MAPGSSGDLLDPGRDLHFGRWHDLGAVPEIDLESVVLRRIVRCSDDDAGHTTEMADAECHHGCRQRSWRDHGLEASPGHDLRRVSGEDGGVVPSIETDDHVSAAQAMIKKVAGEPCCGLADDHSVHSIRSRTQCAAQPSCAELES
jgi:hypothetical protein